MKVRSGGNYVDGFLVLPIKRQQCASNQEAAMCFDGDSPDMDSVYEISFHMDNIYEVSFTLNDFRYHIM